MCIRDRYEAEIEDAKTADEIKEVGRRVLAAKQSREISPNTFEHLAKAGAAKRAELNGKAQEVKPDAGQLETVPS